MHVGDKLVAALQSCMGCTVEGFPQTYLGSPSCEKLAFAAFVLLITKADKYLSGWCAQLLNAGGRLILLNAVLHALPTYAMAA